MPELIEKFTTHLRSVISRSIVLARSSGSREVRIEHVLKALTQEKGSIAAHVLTKSKFTPPAIKKSKSKNARLPELGPDVQRALEKAVTSAALRNHRYVGTEHLLSGILDISNSAIAAHKKGAVNSIKHELSIAMRSADKFAELTDHMDPPAPKQGSHGHFSKRKRGKTPALDFFAVELTNPASGRTLDPVIGREAEIERVVQILCRRTKNNTLLLGDPGVGKTAIVEGLARRIMSGEVPGILAKKRIYALDLPMIVAGTVYRGEFEGRLKQLIEEVKADPDLILFLDEVHTITGAGAATGSIDAANILKPALARGEIRMIGATTITEFKKHIETDAALERRFQSVMVLEPSPEETVAMLKKIKESYESFHDVTITDDAIMRAVQLASRYLPEKFFPDKAIDLIDEAAAGVVVHASDTPSSNERKELEARLERATAAKIEAVEKEAFDAALRAKKVEEGLRAKLKKLSEEKSKVKSRPAVTSRDIVKVISAIHNIPLEELTTDISDKLLALSETIKGRVVGQDETVATVGDRLLRARSGITDPRRPLSSFLFLGPTGVGKTELARVLSAAIYSDPALLLKLDMSEFSEPFTVSKLIGAPAGYVGYRDTALLTDAVKRRPHSVVLFDEIEKAHPDIVHLLLQILEDGTLTDASGTKVSFRNTIVILTSNAGKEIFRGAALGFGGERGKETNEAVKSAAQERLPAELINRLDAVCVFNQLSREHIRKIIEMGIADLNARLKEKGITVHCSSEALDYLAQKSFNPDAGAREIRRCLQEYVENPLGEHLLAGKVRPGDTVHVTAQKNGIILMYP